MSSKPLGLHRREFSQGRLDIDDLDKDPIQEFQRWYDEAEKAGNLDPSAMALATVSPEGAPHVRMVLLKAIDERGFIFCTHQDSPKGKDLQSNPAAAITFYWPELERQVRITGTARWLSSEENAAFFSTRPKGAQIAVLIGHQSDPVEDRKTLDAKFEEASRQFENSDVPPPENWGGYAVMPATIEFWQGRVNRLHDRFRFSRTADGWSLERLMP